MQGLLEVDMDGLTLSASGENLVDRMQSKFTELKKHYKGTVCRNLRKIYKQFLSKNSRKIQNRLKLKDKFASSLHVELETLSL